MPLVRPVRPRSWSGRETGYQKKRYTLPEPEQEEVPVGQWLQNSEAVDAPDFGMDGNVFIVIVIHSPLYLIWDFPFKRESPLPLAQSLTFYLERFLVVGRLHSVSN